MRRILVENIQGMEILAKDIFDNMGTILMIAGITMKVEYKDRLRSLGIRYIYVEDELAVGIHEEENIENQIKEQCQEIMKDVMEKYLTSGNPEFDRLKDVSREVILNVIKKPQIMMNLSGIRRKNEDIYAHSLSVCTMSVMIALRYGLSKKKVENIAIGSLLHDIGFSISEIRDWGYVEEEAMSEKEKRELRMHVITGYGIIENEDWLSKEAKEIVLSHHERLDMSGYPRHLSGKKMGIAVRIVSVCDEFDRMVYGYFTKQLKVPEAFHHIIAQGGRTLDANVVKTFYESVAAYPNGSVVRTNTGEKAIVLRQNYKLPFHPVLRMLEDSEGNKYENWIEEDLADQVSIVIDDILE